MECNTIVPVRIAPKQRNLDDANEPLACSCTLCLLLLQYKREILTKYGSSDPRSPDYGNFYTREQVIATFAADPETIKTVNAWLVDNGIPAASIKQTKNHL